MQIIKNSNINIIPYPMFVSIDLNTAFIQLLVSYTFLNANTRYMQDPNMIMNCIIQDGGEAIWCKMYSNITTISRNAVKCSEKMKCLNIECLLFRCRMPIRNASNGAVRRIIRGKYFAAITTTFAQTFSNTSVSEASGFYSGLN